MDRIHALLNALAATTAVFALAFGGPAFARDPASVTLSVVGEFTPSTSLAPGAAIEALDFEQKARFTRAVMRELPLEDLAAMFGFDSGRFQWSYRSGGCQQSISPNLLATIGVRAGERARVAAFAKAWMYVYQQDAVPYFAAAPGAGRASTRLQFEKEFTPAREGAMFASLIAALGKDAGFTRTGEREIVVIDFNGRDSFYRDVAKFALSMTATNPVVRAEHFTAQSEYPYHDWRAEPDGSSLLAQVAKLIPDHGIEAELRGLRTRYEQVLSGWLASTRADAGERFALSLALP